MTYLDKLENQSIYIIREAYSQFKNIGILWSIGKDSTTLLWLCRKAFMGKLPVPVIHIDTGCKFQKIYEFRKMFAKEWDLNLVTSMNTAAIERGVKCSSDPLECCTELKTNALKNVIHEKKFSALLLGIRRDEHGIRAKERVFSPRDEQFKWNYKDQPPELWDHFKSRQKNEEHIRVHPLLDWTEMDIWQYIKREKMPVVDLYFAKNGKRYRSIGCEPCCSPVDSDADTIDKIIIELSTTTVTERSGRTQDKEADNIMQKLRALGYM